MNIRFSVSVFKLSRSISNPIEENAPLQDSAKAREKSASLAAEKEENITSSVRDDAMNQARNSIIGSKAKPFGDLTQNINKSESKSEQIIEKAIIPQLKHNVSSADNTVYTASMRDDVMNAARNQFSRKISLHLKIPCATSKTRYSEINMFLIKKKTTI